MGCRAEWVRTSAVEQTRGAHLIAYGGVDVAIGAKGELATVVDGAKDEILAGDTVRVGPEDLLAAELPSAGEPARVLQVLEAGDAQCIGRLRSVVAVDESCIAQQESGRRRPRHNRKNR